MKPGSLVSVTTSDNGEYGFIYFMADHPTTAMVRDLRWRVERVAGRLRERHGGEFSIKYVRSGPGYRIDVGGVVSQGELSRRAEGCGIEVP